MVTILHLANIKKKEKLQKKTRERYQNLSKDEKRKKGKCGRE